MTKTDLLKLRERLYEHSRSKQFNMRMTSGMYATIGKLAKQLKVSRSDFVRMAILMLKDRLGKKRK